jgi:hypothetical protein
MDILDIKPYRFKHSKKRFSRLWTQTAALAFGGFDTANTGATEEYDGLTWTSSPASMNTARTSMGEAGTQLAALAFGGDTA